MVSKSKHRYAIIITTIQPTQNNIYILALCTVYRLYLYIRVTLLELVQDKRVLSSSQPFYHAHLWKSIALKE